MRTVFRTDASLQIGSGHVMRCLTLADELRLRGAEVDFICREHHGNLIDFIEGKGYPVVRLPLQEAGYDAKPDDVSHAEWLGVSWQQDAIDTCNALGEIKVNWLIIDHYAIDHRWESALIPQVCNLMVIDDLADRLHECDVLLDQNLFENMEVRYQNLVPDKCIRLLGPRFALLRPEFYEVRKALRQRDGSIGRVLVFFGGVDPTNETLKVLGSLSNITDRSFEVNVVVGSRNPHKEQIQSFCGEYDGFHCHCQVQNMAVIMAEADLAFGAGGSATWERCALGLPSFVTVIADNQKELAEFGARTGLFIKLGQSSDVSSSTILSALRFALNFPEALQHYSQNGLDAVDVKGTDRVANLLYPLQVAVRVATPADCDAIHTWRNAEETRQYFLNSEPVSIESHRVWFQSSLKNPNRVLLIGEVGTKSVGVLRYDILDNEALVSVYLEPSMSGQGLGSQLIRCGTEWIQEHFQQIVVIKAEILRQNVASLRAFESAGYKEHRRIYRLLL